MANEFKHKDPCSTLTQAEYIAACGDGHIFACQATGDIAYASSATVLSKLGKGAAGTILNMGGSCIPAWTATPTIGSTSWCNAGHAHAASNSGGTVCANVLAGTTLKSCVVSSSLTSVGTLTALTVDDVAVNGKVVTMTGSACDTIVMTAAANGAFSLVTTDTAGADGNIVITADGTVDINSAGLLTLDSGAAINIEPAACSAILLDGTISIDAGVVTGATSITSTAFVGTIDGVLGGNTPAAITGTTLSVDNFTLNGTELDLSSGDFALDVAGDVEINADGGCINFKDASLALAAIVNTSCVGELRIHEAANYIGLKPPALSANQTWTWPATKGSACNVLTCDGCGVLSFASAGGGTTINNATANELVTIGATTTELCAEANLLYSSNYLTLLGPADNATSSGINLGTSADNTLGVITYDTLEGRIKIQSNNTANSMVIENVKWYLLDTANGKMSKGLTINQSCADNEAFALKSSDVAHAMTGQTEADTYGALKKYQATSGGLLIDGYKDADGCPTGAIYIRSTLGEAANTAKNCDGKGIIILDARITDGGSGVTSPGSDANLVSISSIGDVVFIFDEEGTAHADVGTATFDDYCDVELLRGFLATTCDQYKQSYVDRFGQELMYNQQWYEDNKLIGKCSIHWKERECGSMQQRAMVNMTGLTMLHHSTILQMADRFSARIDSLETQLKALQGGCP